MIINEKKNVLEKEHNLTVENKGKIVATGVKEVLTFDEDVVVADTQKGILTLKGNELHIDKLNLDSGELLVNGNVDSIVYSDAYKSGKASLLQKLFR